MKVRFVFRCLVIMLCYDWDSIPITASVSPLIASFASILDEMPTEMESTLRTKISIFYTRANRVVQSSESQDKEFPLSSFATDTTGPLPLRLHVGPGRPTLDRTLEQLTRSVSAIQHARGVAIGVCGPKHLIRDVRKMAKEVCSEERAACGGLEIHEEWVNKSCIPMVAILIVSFSIIIRYFGW